MKKERTKKEKLEHPSYYVIIPAEVRYCKNLKSGEKLLYGEITALSNKLGYCYAKNTYLGELYDVEPTTISEWVNNLKLNGFITITGEKGINRRISLTNILRKIPKVSQEPIGKAEAQPIEKPETNITSINNKDTTYLAENTQQEQVIEKEYSPESYLDYKINSGKPHEKVVALYIKYKKLYLKCSDIKGLQAMIYDPVNLKFGKMIMGFKPEEMIKAMKKLDSTMINGEKMTWGITHLKNALNR
jgi:hypothetical protein